MYLFLSLLDLYCCVQTNCEGQLLHCFGATALDYIDIPNEIATFQA